MSHPIYITLQIQYSFIFNSGCFITCYINMTDNRTLVKVALAVGGLASLALLAREFFFTNAKAEAVQQPAPAPLSLQDARQVMLQIKYQMLVVCINYAQKMSKDMMQFIPVNQKEAALQKLKLSMIKIYQSKQNVILEKHMISKDNYATSLMCYESDPFLAKNKAEILIMMERAVNGEYPIFDIPEEALTVNSLDQMVDIYQELCTIISSAVWRKMFECTQNDPSFDTNNDEHFKMAIRQINIYAMKVQYLQGKGYTKEWGCPNEIFLKATQSQNLKNPAFKLKIRTIQKAYNKLIDLVSNTPMSIKEGDISSMLQNEIAIIQQQEINKKRDNTIPDKNDLPAQTQFFLNKGREAQQEVEKSRGSSIIKEKEPEESGETIQNDFQ